MAWVVRGAVYFGGMESRRRWIGVSLLVLTLLGGGARFWRIGTPPEITSDEVYFVNDARHYLRHEPFLDVHPPLGKLVIAFGIALAGDTPVGWRWPVALLGTLLVPLMFFVGRRLTGSTLIGIVAAALVAVDGMFVVESRLGLLNITLAFATLLAVWLAARAKTAGGWAVAGAVFGLAIGVKWSALLLVFPVAMLAWQRDPRFVLRSALGFTAAALIVYIGLFELHFALTGMPQQFWLTHYAMLRHHTGIAEQHAYQSPWWSWLVLWRPFMYATATAADGSRQLIADLGNPVLWWGGVVGAVTTVIALRKDRRVHQLLLFVLAALVPFAAITRPLFSYHAMLAVPFLWLLALVGWRTWLGNSRRRLLISGVVLAIVFTVSAWFWPVWTARPLSPDQVKTRQWLPTWFVPRPGFR